MKAVSPSKQDHVRELFGTHMSDSLAVKAQPISQHVSQVGASPRETRNNQELTSPECSRSSTLHSLAQMPVDEPFARFKSESVCTISLRGRKHEKGDVLLGSFDPNPLVESKRGRAPWLLS